VRTIAVVTTSRADYSYYIPLLNAIRAEPELRVCLLVSGMHLSPQFGLTVSAIEADGFPIAARIEMLLGSDTPEAIAKAMGLGTIGFGQKFAEFQPDILVVLGDRFEMHAAVVAALPFNIPIAHIGGGEATEGLIDEAIRHSITKMSHLHFVSHQEYAKRVIQMGEEPWRVSVTGALSLDNVHSLKFLSDDELSARIGLPFEKIRPLVVTYHPLTLNPGETVRHISDFLAALHDSGHAVVFTATNADTSGHTIMAAIDEYVASHGNARVVDSLGLQGYFSLLRRAAGIAGNSSSGILEAATFELPVLNIGSRQRGRLHGSNVVDCADDKESISKGLMTILDQDFRARLRGFQNPYGSGTAADKIVKVLKSVELGPNLIIKPFYGNK
jgi:UDP-N-acetylglucosamine 2-epimerase (non-hydrolysing)/GDP/UDP-N,N'-diacetylbacillosamine 2-epimerase (hydrolysing)